MARSSVERNEEFGALSNGTLIFPQDMEKEFYPESIKFGIYERQGPSYSALKGNVKALAGKKTENNPNEPLPINTKGNGSSGSFDATATAKSQILDKAEQAGNSITNGVRTVIDKGKSLGRLGKQTIDEITKLKKETAVENHIQSVYLNMPSSVVFSEAVGWQGADMGVIGALKTGNVKGALEGGLLSQAGTLLGGGVGALAGAIPGISGLASTVIGGLVGSGAFQSGIENSFNIKANPYKEQTFQGVDFRTFDFTFTLRARSQSDVDVIQQIIRTFRANSKPTFEKNTGGAVFSYPKEFKIEFLTIDSNNSYETNEYLPEIKYCVCTAVNTNYTGQGWRSFESGAPVDISLQLTFQETEIITGEDVMGETEVGRYKDSERMF